MSDPKRQPPNPVHPQGPDGRFVVVANRPLNDQQAEFVRQYVENGGRGAEAARKAGYSPETAAVTASRLLSLDHVARAVEAGRTRRLAVAGAKAIGVVIAVLDDDKASMALRLKAAEIALKADGRERELTKKTEQSKPLNEYSVAELEDLVRRGKAAAAAAAAPVLDGQVVRLEDDNAQPSAATTTQPIDTPGEGTAL